MIKFILFEMALPKGSMPYRKRFLRNTGTVKSGGVSRTVKYGAPRSGMKFSVRPNVRWTQDDEGKVTDDEGRRYALDHLSMTLHKGDIKAGTPTSKKTHAAHAVVLSDVDLHPDNVIHHPTRKRDLNAPKTKLGLPRKTPHAYASGTLVSGGFAPSIDSIDGMERLVYNPKLGVYHLQSDKSARPIIWTKNLIGISDGNPLGVRGGFYVSGYLHAEPNQVFSHSSKNETFVSGEKKISLILDEHALNLLIGDVEMDSLNGAINKVLNEGVPLGPVYEIDRIRNMLINFGYNPLISGIEFSKASAAGNQVFENPDGSKVSIVVAGTDKTHGNWTFESKMKTKCGKSKKALEILLLNHAMGDD